MLALKEGIDNLDNKKILSALTKLRKLSNGCEINRRTFELLVELIKMPNEKILNYALSILANLCLKDTYRKMFKELRGIPHVMVIIKSVTSNSIICRACRLIGNLTFNRDLVRTLYDNDAGSSLMKLIEKHETLSSDALAMVFRAFKKVWSISQLKWQVVANDLMPLFNKCLNCEDEQVVQLTIESLALITDWKNIPKRNKFEISKDFFENLINLSRNEDLNKSVIICLSNLLCFATSNVWKFLEGSNIAEIYIEYLKKNDEVTERVYKAFYKLCTEGAIRIKVRLAGLLSRLIDSCNSKNKKILVATFSLFQYDLISMKICSENPKFVPILINNIKEPGATHVLAVLSRLSSPAKELVASQNLDVIINNKECNGILKNIVSTTEFLMPLILSGKIWQIEKVGCKMDEICSAGYVEYLLIQLLSHSSDEKSKEEVSLATPFLIQVNNFKLLHKLLTQYRVMKTILDLLRDCSAEEKILATVVRLITVFRYNYENPQNFFQDFMGGETPSLLGHDTTFQDLNSIVPECDGGATSSAVTKTVTFEFDNGGSLNVDKNWLSSKSPVLNSMLNGHFAEAQQDKIKLKNCTQRSFTLMVNYLNGQCNFSDVETDTYLDLLSLSDRYLLFKLNSHLTENFTMDANGCTLAYKWYRQAGHTGNNRKIGRKIYEFMFSSAENLLAIMKDETCRLSIVSEISQYLADSLRDTQ